MVRFILRGSSKELRTTPLPQQVNTRPKITVWLVLICETHNIYHALYIESHFIFCFCDSDTVVRMFLSFLFCRTNAKRRT